MLISKTKKQYFYFIGISLAPNSANESGVAILDEKKNIIFLDKLFSVDDLKFFISNYSGKKNSIFSVSIPENVALINNKWKYIAKKYQQLNPDDFKQKDWLKKYSNRGSEYFSTISEENIPIVRYDVTLIKQFFNISHNFKNRTSSDCKNLQKFLQNFLGYDSVTSNLMPAAQLEALLGASLSYNIYFEELKTKQIFIFESLPVINFY